MHAVWTALTVLALLSGQDSPPAPDEAPPDEAASETDVGDSGGAEHPNAPPDREVGDVAAPAAEDSDDESAAGEAPPGEADATDDTYDPADSGPSPGAEPGGAVEGEGEEQGEPDTAANPSASMDTPRQPQTDPPTKRDPAAEILEAIKPQPVNHAFDLGVLAGVGASACHFLVLPCGIGNDGTVIGVPYGNAGPGVGFRGRYRYFINERWTFAMAGSFKIGGFTDGTPLGQLGSYGGRLAFDYTWFNLDWVGVSTELHLGVRSFSLVPVPLLGSTTEVFFNPLAWLDQEWVRWRIGVGVTTDLLIIVPSAQAYVATRLTGQLFGVQLGVEGIAGAHGDFAIITNSVGAEASVRALVGYAF